MTRLVFLVLPLVGLFGVWAGTIGDGHPSAWFVGAGTGLAGALFIWNIAMRRTRVLSRGVNAWMGKVDVQPVVVDGGPDHRELATALNTLGAAYGRRGLRLDEAGPNVEELISGLPEPAVLFRPDGVVAAINEPARELLGAAGGTELSMTQALGSAALADLVGAALAGEADVALDEVDLGRRVIAARATAFAGHVLLLVSDLTESRRIAEVRRDFVTNASHELKTPVAGIQSLADAMNVVIDDDPVRARQLLGRLRGEAERLSTLVGDLLSLRRVDDRVADADVEAVDLERLAAEVLAGATVSADARAIEVALEVDPGLRVTAVLDDLRLALTNLVDNAVKYNRDGGTVTIVATKDGENIRVDVTDDGIGIPSQDADRIFERFYRVDPGRSRDAGGTGLGLSIVRHAIERNGGTIEVESLLGVGTTFIIRLPAA